MDRFEDHPNTRGCLTSLTNKPQQKQPGKLSEPLHACIVSYCVQLLFDGEKCGFLLCAWKIDFLKSGHLCLSLGYHWSMRWWGMIQLSTLFHLKISRNRKMMTDNNKFSVKQALNVTEPMASSTTYQRVMWWLRVHINYSFSGHYIKLLHFLLSPWNDTKAIRQHRNTK